MRCSLPLTPGGHSLIAKRVPLSGGGVPSLRAPMSWGPSPIAMSAGIASLHQSSVEVAPRPTSRVVSGNGVDEHFGDALLVVTGNDAADG